MRIESAILQRKKVSTLLVWTAKSNVESCLCSGRACMTGGVRKQPVRTTVDQQRREAGLRQEARGCCGPSVHFPPFWTVASSVTTTDPLHAYREQRTLVALIIPIAWVRTRPCDIDIRLQRGCRPRFIPTIPNHLGREGQPQQRSTSRPQSQPLIGPQSRFTAHAGYNRAVCLPHPSLFLSPIWSSTSNA
jgi:hypothetical protein